MIGIVGSPRRDGNTETAPMNQVEGPDGSPMRGDVRKETGAPRAGISGGEKKGEWQIIHGRFSQSRKGRVGSGGYAVPGGDDVPEGGADAVGGERGPGRQVLSGSLRG